MKAKSIVKRELSLLLVVSLLLSCWVFTAPIKSVAATAGTYDVKVTISVGNTMWSSGTQNVRLYYKSDNGTGTESSNAQNFDTYNANSIEKTWSNVGFPTKVACYCGGSSTWNAKVQYGVTVQVKPYNAGSYTTVYSEGNKAHTHSSGATDSVGSFTDTIYVSSSNYPKATSVNFTAGATAITLNTNGNNNTSTYAATVYDQYGVAWYQDVPASGYTVSSHTGVSMSNKVLTLTSSANAAENYTLTITAKFSDSVKQTRNCTVTVFKYKVTFYDDNGTTVLKAEQTVNYNGTASAPNNPTKASTNFNDYSFAGWTGDTYKNITSGKQTRIVKASYNSTAIKYTIKFEDGDGKQIGTCSPGFADSVTMPSSTATKTETAQYTYKFAGWSTDGTSATAVSVNSQSTPSSLGLSTTKRSITYKAYFTPDLRSYDIKFVSADTAHPDDSSKTTTETKNTDYGSTPVPTTPADIDTDLWTRTFTGWDKTIASVTGEATYTAQYTTTYYNYVINYKNGDNTNALTNTIHYDGTLKLPEEGTITKAPDEQYTYTFVGWKEGTEATWSEDATAVECVSISDSTKPSDIGLSKSSLTKTYCPYFLATKNEYTITFNWKDANYADQSQTLTKQVYGTTPTAPTVPLTVTTNDKIYTFKGWNTEGGTVARVTGDKVYTAIYAEEFRPYNITFSWVNPADVSQQHTHVCSVRYGTPPEAPNLSNLSIAGYAADEHVYTTPLGTYTFNAWKPTIVPVVGATTYEADYSLVKTDYTLTFYDEDGETVLAAPTYNWDSGLSAPASPTKAATAQYSYTFAGWKVDDTETVVQPSYFTGKTLEDLGGNHYYTATYSSTVNQYTITYKDEDGKVIKTVSGQDYGTVPADLTGANAAPALSEKDPDDTNHYTAYWYNESEKTLNDAITGDTVFSNLYKATAHTLGEVTTKEKATCVATGIDEQTCSVCNHVVQTVTPINPNGHDRKQESVTPGDDSTGYECFHCTRCGNYWAAVYNEKTQIYEVVNPNTSGERDVANVKDGSTPVPAPYFNYYKTDASEEGFDYDYSYRDSSLKLMKDAYVDTENTRQDFRFSGAVTIPEGVSYKVDPSKNVNEVNNVILDFGFVYTQDWYNQGENSGYGAAKLTLENVAKYSTGYAKMSVVENNHNDKIDNGAFNGSNWSGVTYHPKTAVRDVETLTFNLVISMKAKNWKKQYAARPYITYKYHGVVYTVYDGGASDQSVTYSFGSVYAIAAASISTNKDKTSEVVLDYVKKRIIANRDALGTDAATDWWRWFNEYESYEENVNNPNSLYNWYLSELEAL